MVITVPRTGPAVLQRSCEVPLWSQLGDDLTRRIETGEFDDAFPGELTIAEEYHVSRQTVRMALRSLREAGIVSADRGRSPRVLAPRIEQPLGGLYSLFASVEAAGMVQRSEVLALESVTDPAAATQLGLPATTELVHLSRLRLAANEPLALDRVWLPATFAAAILQADFTHTALYDELDRRCGGRPQGGSEEIDAVILDGSNAPQLGSAPGAAAFAIHRLGCFNDRPVEWRETLIRADRFRIRAQFSPLRGYQLSVGTVEDGKR
ncbi:GntR family transcriptional regulator [Propionibacteriaceae bacterium Y2011]